jgi:DNA-binding NtrC family response regulator
MRPLDIEVLAENFVKKYCKINHLEEKQLSQEALSIIKASPWKGNVRELENIIHRTVLMSSDRIISPETVFPDYENPAQAHSINNLLSKMNNELGFVGRTVQDVEKELIIDTLSHCLGNRTHAANILGISIRTLRNKLKQYSEGGLHMSDEDMHGDM